MTENNPYQYINLVFDGLDTFSKIYLNDELIGKSDNMFVKFIFNITPYVKVCYLSWNPYVLYCLHSYCFQENNNLTIKFDSPIKTAEYLYMKQAEDYIVPPKCVPKEYNGECHANFVRKMQASFSWDWGPAFPSVGIWYY